MAIFHGAVDAARADSNHSICLGTSCHGTLSRNFTSSSSNEAIGIVSRKVLADTLKELEEDGIVLRSAYKELPPRVEYSLTPKGAALLPILRQLTDWAGEYYDENIPA